MNKRERVLVVDVETCGTRIKKVYDLGFAVVERTTGKIIERYSLVISDVFYGRSREMKSAYYANKLPLYHAGIEAGEFDVVSLVAARDLVTCVMAVHGISKVYAYNCAFDRDALNQTVEFISAGFVHEFFPAGTEFRDIWHLACVTIMVQKSYRTWCEAHGLVSEAGNLRTSAEACFSYITKQVGFEEAHTGMADVEIEVRILHHAIRQHKPLAESINRRCWVIPQG